MAQSAKKQKPSSSDVAQSAKKQKPSSSDVAQSAKKQKQGGDAPAASSAGLHAKMPPPSVDDILDAARFASTHLIELSLRIGDFKIRPQGKPGHIRARQGTGPWQVYYLNDFEAVVRNAGVAQAAADANGRAVPTSDSAASHSSGAQSQPIDLEGSADESVALGSTRPPAEAERRPAEAEPVSTPVAPASAVPTPCSAARTTAASAVDPGMDSPLKMRKGLVGRRIRIWWGGSRRWFSGTVKAFDPDMDEYCIRYDDGEERQVPCPMCLAVGSHNRSTALRPSLLSPNSSPAT